MTIKACAAQTPSRRDGIYRLHAHKYTEAMLILLIGKQRRMHRGVSVPPVALQCMRTTQPDTAAASSAGLKQTPKKLVSTLNRRKSKQATASALLQAFITAHSQHTGLAQWISTATVAAQRVFGTNAQPVFGLRDIRP